MPFDPCCQLRRFIKPKALKSVDGGVAMAAGLAGWLSIGPYPFFGSTLHLLVGSILMSGVFVALFVSGKTRTLNAGEIAGVAFLTLFLVYASLMPRLDGSTSKWVFVLPTLWSLALMTTSQRIHALRIFRALFAISLLPAIVASFWLVLGLPIEPRTMPYYHPTMAADGNVYLQLPGALFLEGNSVVLPWGGVFFRTSAIYDEPGMVGTVAALLIAAHRFELSRPLDFVLLVGGLVSGSLAFLILLAMGFAMRVAWRAGALLRAVGHRRVAAFVAAGFLAIGLALAVAEWSVSGDRGALARDSDQPTAIDAPFLISGQDGARPVAVSGELREPGFANRNLADFNDLKAEFWASDPRTLLFGIAADASARRAPTSQVFHRIYVDYGLVGFSLLAAGFAAFSLSMVRFRAARFPVQDGWGLAFVFLYLVSFYQRPTIWLPYALTLFLCGLSRALPPRPHDPGRR